jgi:uncharacterized protein (TIGR02646 family)
MKKIDKDINDVPVILQSKTRKDYFKKNIKAKKYLKTELYKHNKVKEKLKLLYGDKCAYCEKSLLDFPQHIEHYRPKSIYYWLVCSWDNLFLCCHHCNSFKGDKFETLNKRVLYKNEVFENIHQLGDGYDKIEQPLTINPEKENVLDEIIFNKKAEITSTNKRVKHTIENVCNLNRKELVEKRVRVLNGFINKINDIIFINQGHKKCSQQLKPVLKKFKEEQEFFSLRYFVIKNYKLFR